MAPAAPLILFAPGAGAPSTSPFMNAWAERLGTLGVVERFDYDYMKAGRKSPDRPPVLIAAHRKALDAARARHGADRPVVLAGKSMGSRIGCHLANELAGEGAAPVALICFGYPLRAAGSGASRAEVLQALSTPILFLAGSRDPLCPLDTLAEVRPTLKVPNELFVVEGGDHSLAVRKKTARSQAEWDDAMLAAVGDFLRARGLKV